MRLPERHNRMMIWAGDEAWQTGHPANRTDIEHLKRIAYELEWARPRIKDLGPMEGMSL